MQVNQYDLEKKNDKMQVKQIVKFKEPKTEAEAKERFKVVWIDKDRICVQLLSYDFTIKPTNVYNVEDMILAD